MANQPHHKAYTRKSKSGKTENISALGEQLEKAAAARKDLEEVAGFPSTDSLKGSKVADKWRGDSPGDLENGEWRDAGKSAGGDQGDQSGTPAARIRSSMRANPGQAGGGAPPKDPNWTGGPGSGSGDWDPYDTRWENVKRTIAQYAVSNYQRNSKMKRDMGVQAAQDQALMTAFLQAGVEFPTDITWQNPDTLASQFSEVRQEAFTPRVHQQSSRDAEEQNRPDWKNRVDQVGFLPESATTRKQKRGMTGYVDQTTDAKGHTGQLGVGKSNSSKAKIQKAVQDKKYSREHLVSGYRPPKSNISNKQFLNNASPEERSWINQQMDNPDGAFFGARGNQVPGKYRKWQQYVNARQAGYAPPTESKDKESEWKTWLSDDQRGQKTNTTGATNPNRAEKSASDRTQATRRTRSVTRPEGTRASQRYSGNPVSHEDFGFGIKVPGVDSVQKIMQDHSDDDSFTAVDAFKMQQSNIQSNYETMLQNDRSAHEQRQEQLLGRKFTDTSAGKSDRVVFFTTSTGFPAASVGASSLLGQYIIKKRKAMVVGDKQASRAQVKGEFPRAVRDQHLIEISTGLSLGAQGRYGVYKQNGWKKGNKTSQGYGKALPMGAQVLRGEDGTPVYDSNGNVRYTEGYTRPFSVGTDSNVGLRIYIG